MNQCPYKSASVYLFKRLSIEELKIYSITIDKMLSCTSFHIIRSKALNPLLVRKILNHFPGPFQLRCSFTALTNASGLTGLIPKIKAVPCLKGTLNSKFSKAIPPGMGDLLAQ